MRLRHIAPLVVLVMLSATQFVAVAAVPYDACTLASRADVAKAVGGGTVSPGRLHRYAGDPVSECQYDTEAGNVVVTFDPTNHSQFFSAVRASYGVLETVPGIGDGAVYSKEHGTLAFRKGNANVLLTLDTPDEVRGCTVVVALARRIAPRLKRER